MNSIKERLTQYRDKITNQLQDKARNHLVGINKTKAKKYMAVAILGCLLDVWLLSTVSSWFCGNYYNSFAEMGMDAPKIPRPGWYFSHPFIVSWLFLKHIFFGYQLSVPEVFTGWLLLNMFILSSIGAYYIREKYVKDEQKGLGTAKFEKPEEVKDYLQYDYGPGIMFGGIKKGLGLKPAILKEDAPGNRNVAIFGPPGSRKSSTYISNNLFQAVRTGCSIIVTDPKGELTRLYSKWFEKKGYKVKVFNLVNMLNSDRWNALSLVKDELDAQLFTNVVIANTVVPGRKGGEQFWENLEKALLKALVLYVINDMPQNNRNLGTLYSLLSCGDPTKLDEIFDNLSMNHPARKPYNFIRKSSEVVKTGTISGLGTRLEVFQNKLVCDLTSGNDIDVELPGKEKCVYFCILSDKDSTFDFLASLFFSFLFVKLTDLADRQPDGVLPVRVNALLDEFCNISNIPDFTKKLSTMRGRGIACSIVFQNIPQLKSSGDRETWEIILGDCDYWLILGTKELTSAEYVSKLIGDTTVEMDRDTKPKGLASLNPFAGSISKSPTKRNLLDPSEVTRLDINECLLRLQNGKVIKLDKFWYKHYPWINELEESHISNYLPKWAQDYMARNGKQDKKPPVRKYSISEHFTNESKTENKNDSEILVEKQTQSTTQNPQPTPSQPAVTNDPPSEPSNKQEVNNIPEPSQETKQSKELKPIQQLQNLNIQANGMVEDSPGSSFWD